MSSAFHSAVESYLIGILNIAANGNSVGKARNLNIIRFKNPYNVCGGRIAAGGGVSGNYDLTDTAGLYPFNKLPDREIGRGHVIDRRECAAEHVIATAVSPDLFHNHNVLCVFNNADHGAVPILGGADSASVRRGRESEANRTFMNVTLDTEECIGKAHDVFVI